MHTPPTLIRSHPCEQAKIRELDELAPPPTAHRKERMLRALALKPPPGSPFAQSLCLAGIEGLLAQQNSGQATAAPAGPVSTAVPAAASSHMPPANVMQLHATQQLPAVGMLPAGHMSHQGGMPMLGHPGVGVPANAPQHSMSGHGAAGLPIQSGMPAGFGRLLQFPHVNLMPSQPDRGRMHFGALPMQ